MMNIRLFSMMVCLILTLTLLPMTVSAKGQQGAGGLSEQYYNSAQSFGYDALTSGGQNNGELDGLASVSVGTANLTRNSAASTTGAAVANGVTIGFQEGYYLDSYKIVCGDKYGCRTDASGKAVSKSNVMSGATTASITLGESDGITKAAFGHSSQKAPYWLLLKLAADSTLYSVTYNWGELADDLTAALPETKSYKVNAIVTVASPGASALSEAATIGENGYQFLGWQLDLDSETHQANDTFGMPRKNVVLTALWKKIAATEVHYTINVPIVKTVVQDGSAAPGAQTFQFAMIESDTPAEFEILNDTIETTGAGTFEGVYSIRVSEETFRNLSEGFAIAEVNGEAADWTYDETVWGVVPYMDNSGEISVRFANLSAEEELWGKTEYEYTAAEFTNTYSANTAAEEPEQPEAPKPEAPKPDSQNPSTGDSFQPWLLALLLLASGTAAASALLRRKHSPGK